MISETLEPITRGGVLVFFWIFLIIMWYISYCLVKENTRFGNEINTPYPIDYALAGVVVVVMGGVTFFSLMATLSMMGV